jgi:hypothetical protein
LSLSISGEVTKIEYDRYGKKIWRGIMREYAVYKGEDILCIGTVHECAKFLEIKPDTVRFYASPKYLSRLEKRKNPKNYIIVVKLDDDDE